MTEHIDLDFSIEEDELIQNILNAKGRTVNVIAFGVIYAGVLEDVNIEDGIIRVVDGEDKVVLEIERVESITVTVP